MKHDTDIDTMFKYSIRHNVPHDQNKYDYADTIKRHDDDIVSIQSTHHVIVYTNHEMSTK